MGKEVLIKLKWWVICIRAVVYEKDGVLCIKEV